MSMRLGRRPPHRRFGAAAARHRWHRRRGADPGEPRRSLFYSRRSHWRGAGLSPDRSAPPGRSGSRRRAFCSSSRRAFHDRPQRRRFSSSAARRFAALDRDEPNPGPDSVIALQAMHGLSFGATTCGSVLLLGSLASATHRARMQGWLASVSSLSLAAATFACGRLTGLWRKRLSRHGGAGRAAPPPPCSPDGSSSGCRRDLGHLTPPRPNGRRLAADKARNRLPPCACGGRARSAYTSPASRTA